MSSLVYNLRNRKIFTSEDKWHVLLLVVENTESEWFRSRMRCTSKFISKYCTNRCALHDIMTIEDMNTLVQSTIHCFAENETFCINYIINFKKINKSRIFCKISPKIRFTCKMSNLEKILFSYTVYPSARLVFESLERPLLIDL